MLLLPLPSSVVRRPSSVVRRPSSVVRRRRCPSSVVVRRRSSVVRRPSSIVDRPSSVVRRPSPIVPRRSSVVDRRSSVVRRPSSVVRRPSSVVRRPSSVVVCNAKNITWWGNVDDYQGIQLDQIAVMYGNNQIIDEPTNFEPHCDQFWYSCIIIRTLPSSIERCHHQIVYAEVFYPLPYRKIWDYKNADIYKINEIDWEIDWDRH